MKGGAADRWGRAVSETERKGKEDGGVGCCGEAVGGCWAAGPKGKRGKLFFLFFFKLFSKHPFKFKCKSNLFQLFTEFL
jgi:hypothetical protein